MSTYLFMRIDLPSGAKVGPSRTAILEGIEKFGSITGAAQAVGLTYRQVWATVKVMNVMFKEPVVEISPRGRASGARLTPFGRQVATRFREMEKIANQALKSHFRAFERMASEDLRAPAPVPQWAHIEGAVVTKSRKKSRKPKAKAR